MPPGSVLDAYQEKIRGLSAAALEAGTGQNQARFLVFGALAAGFLLAVNGLLWSFPVALAVMLFAGRRYTRYQRQGERLARVLAFYERGVARLTGEWAGKGYSGEAYGEEGHLYEHDLNILGSGSLFELLATARTEIGRRRLAAYLLHPAPAEEIVARQQAVAELRDRSALREEIVTLGKHEFSECKATAFAEWLDAPPARFPGMLPVFAAASGGALITLLALMLAQVVAWNQGIPVLLGLAALQGAIGLWAQERVRAILQHGRSLVPEVGILQSGMALLRRESFTSAKLTELAGQARSEPGTLRRLLRLMRFVRARDSDWLYWLSIYLMLGTQLAWWMERWRMQHAAQFREWLDTWAEFEALNSVACHAHEHPGDVFPEMAPAEEDACFCAEELGHPLLVEDVCVRNDVDLGPETRFLVISGSNMSGKSTLLRSIGINAVLAQAGAPVRAARLRMTPLHVCASIGAQDSLLEGKSKFLAEVERIRDTLASPRPVLFVIDEIFSGTNSHDRRIAAEAVVRALLEAGAVGGLSTHDLALTEIAAAAELHGENVHMAARDPASPLDFDYRLKPGANRQSNALAIARLAGVGV